MHSPSMPRLREFRELVGADQDEVARATGVAQSTISRIETEEIKRPRYDIVTKIQAWADDAARKKRLRATERLSWDHLLERRPRGAAA